MSELICPTCGLGIAEGSRFCSQCGVPLSVKQPLEKDNNHRDIVLQSLRALMPQPLADKLNAAAPEIIGERREVTVLFLDIVNFTATSHVLDSEEIYIWTDRAMRLLAEVIYKYEGTIDKYTGDGLMALFGVPVAHENDPARAIRAALDMIFALEPLQTRFKEKYGLDLQVRIGINTGTVIAGKIGSDLHVEVTVIGNTVNLANRLQSVAEPNTIAVSFETYQRTHPLFAFNHLPPIAVKGKPEPIRVFQPLRLRERPKQIRGIPGLLVPMVGREQALFKIQNALTDVREFGRSQFVLVTGEAGVGKSRLVKEFSESVSHSRISFYQGVCLTYTRTNPFRLMASLLRDIMQLSEADPVEVQYAALRVYLDQLKLDTDYLAPFLLNVLGFEQEYPMIQAFLNRLDSTVLQKQIHSALRQVLLAEITKAPTVLVLDDLHWVDPASRDFLEHLVQTMGDIPLMLILVTRDFGPQTVVHSLITTIKSSRKHFIDIKLKPLTEKEGQQLVSQLIKLTDDKAIILKQRISERAEGNPFYAEEIIRMLIDQGGLMFLNGQWHLQPQVDELLQKVPSTLNGLVSARLDSLSADIRQTLQKAAILGSDFPLHLLQTLTGLDTKVITAHMDELVTKQFLIDLPLWQRQGYTFRHTLVQKIIYNTLLKRDRQSIHTQVAEVIKQDASWLPYDKIEALAYHYSESTDPISAVPYLVDAGERAVRRCSNETAVQHYRKALALVMDHTDRDERQVLRIQMGLGQALKFLGEFSEASQILEDSLLQLLSVSMRFDIEDLMPILVNSLKELADIRVREGALDTATSHLQAGLDALGEQGSEIHPQFWRSLMDRLAWVRFRQGDLKNSFSLASSATLNSDSDTDDDPMTLASLYNTLGGIFWQWGNLSEASRYVEKSLRLHQKVAYAWGMAIAYTNLGILHYSLGRWPEALESFSHAFTLRRDNGYLPQQALNLCNLGQLRIAMGDHTQAQMDLDDGLAISKQLGEEFGIVLAKIGLGQLAVIQSQFVQAVDHTRAVLDMADAAGDHQIAHAGWLMALSQAGLGDINLGIKTAETALETARNAGLTETEADCCRVLGVLHTQAGNFMDAEALLREAVDLCLQVKVPYGQGLALYELGLLYHTMADIDDKTQMEWNAKAVSMLEQSERQLELLGANYDLELTRTALCEIRSKMPPEELSYKDIDDSSLHQISVQSENLPKGDRRPVTIVCLSLRPPKDSDEEIIFDFMTQHLQAAATISAEYQGQVIWRKNGLTLVFGAPQSYEDDAMRAVQTAYQLSHRLPSVGEQKEFVTDFGIAVSQGDVIVGQIGSELHTEFSVTGGAVRMAENLADATPSGRIFVTDKVRVSTERVFIYQPVGDIENLPITESTLAEVIDQRERPEPARGLPGLKSRLIGRENQLQKMLELSRILNQGVGGLIWIEGEPGVGKSRLIAEFTTSIAENGILLWVGASSPHKSDHAFSLISNVLAQALNVRSIDTPDQIRVKIDQGMQNWPKKAMLVRSYLEILLGLRPSGLEAERLASLEPEQLRQQVFVSFRRLLKILGTQRPLMIVLDDLHWIDPMSAELLNFLVTLVVSVPILFVCAQRRQGVDSPNDRLVKVQSLIPTQTIQIHLPRLTQTECQDLLHDLLPQETLPSSIVQIVLERSEGNPYFIEEFVRMLIAQGYLQQTEGSWQVNTGQDISDLPIPPSLEVLVQSRIDALPPNLKQILQEASVIGTPIDTSILEKVSEISNVKNEINRLESRLLMVWIPEANQWQFSHHMIQTVAYNTMLKVRREAIHLRVAEVMELQWAQNKEDHAEELAYHFTQSGYCAKAISYLIIAGERAITHYANEEAISFLEQAENLLDAVIDAADDLYWRIKAGLGDAYRAVGRHADSVATLKEGLDLTLSANFSNNHLAGLYRRLGDTYRKQGEMDIAREQYRKALSILSAITDPQAQIESARCQTGIAWSYFLQGQLSTAQESCKSALDSAREVESLAELATAENLMGGIHYQQSEWIPALHHTTRAMVLREQMGYTWGVASTLGNLGILAVTAGQWNKAWSFFERSLALQQEIGDIEGLAIAHNNLGSLARDQGKLKLAEYHFRESLKVATPFEMLYHIANSGLGLAQVLILMGLFALAEEAMSTSLKWATEIGADGLIAEIHKIEAEISLHRSNYIDARTSIQHATALAAQLDKHNLGLLHGV